MERVSTATQNSALLAELMRAQRSQFEAQREVASGKIVHEFSDVPDKAGVLLAARRADARTAEYASLAGEMRSRLDVQDAHLSRVAEEAQGLRQALLQAVAQEDATALMAKIESAYRAVQSVLNTRIDGKYLYGGTRTDVSPVNAATLADLQALPAVDDAFDNNDVKPAGRIDDNQTVEYGVLASDVGTELFGILRALADFNAGVNGPFSDPMTAAQLAELRTQANALETASANLEQINAENGIRFQEAEAAIARHEDSRIYLKGVVADIEDADLAEAVSKLNQAQVSVQASAKAFATIQNLTLLDYMR